VTRVGSVAIAAAVVLLLAGCFGPDRQVLIDQAHDDFDGLVTVASAVDEAVLHTLEVEKPSAEACDPESKDARNTVFIAAGTMAIQSAATDEFDLLEQFRPSFDDGERWTRVDDLGEGQLAWVDVDGITASVKIDQGLLVIAVFSPCRS
jgi:hypothetical protein